MQNIKVQKFHHYRKRMKMFISQPNNDIHELQYISKVIIDNSNLFEYAGERIFVRLQ